MARVALRRGLGALVAQLPAVQEACHRKGERIADEARAILLAEAYETGAAHASVRVENTDEGARVIGGGIAPAGLRFVHYFVYLEKGTSTRRGLHIMARAAQLVGR